MFSIETSKDLLNIVIAVSIFGLAVFACISSYYFAMILRQTFKIIKEMRERIHKIDEAVDAFKEKIEHSSSYLLLIGEGIKKLTEVAKEHVGGISKKVKRKKPAKKK